MKDDFEATFVVDLAPDDVWETLTSRTLKGDPGSEGEVHYVLAGFPSVAALPHKGASFTLTLFLASLFMSPLT